MSIVGILISFGILGTIVWLLDAYVLSELSGWRALASRFGTDGPPNGRILVNDVVGVGPGPGFPRLLNRSATRRFRLLPAQAGLYLDCGSRRFRWPPLLVPWHEVRCTGHRTFLWSEIYELNLGHSAGYFAITPNAFRLIAPFLQEPSAAQQAVEADGRTSS